MSIASVGPLVGSFAALGAHHRHGGRYFALAIIVVVVVVAVILYMQRRRDHRSIVDAPLMSQSETLSPDLKVGEQKVQASATQQPTSAGAQQPPLVQTKLVMPPGRYGIVGLIRSEWTKLRTVRSTMWTLGITVVLGIGIGVLTCAETRSHWATMSFGDRATFDATMTSLVGLFVGQFAIGILGALVMSAEYGTGTIRATLSAAPRRPMVLVAKSAVFGAVALVVAEVVSFLSFFVGQALLTAPATHTTLASPGALRAVVGCGLYVCVLGLLALGLATIIRHTAGAISAFVGILLVLPLIVSALPQSLSMDIRRYLPDRIGDVMISMNGTAGPNVFSPWVGFLVLCLYATAALVIGGVLLVRRDA